MQLLLMYEEKKMYNLSGDSIDHAPNYFRHCYHCCCCQQNSVVNCKRKYREKDLVVVFDAHADAIEHNGDQDGALNVPAFNEALDTSTHSAHSPTCTVSNSKEDTD